MEERVSAYPAQLNLFNEPNESLEKEQEEVTYTRNKSKYLNKQGHSRQALPADLPREVITIEPENVPEGAKKMGEVVTEVLEYKPGVMYVTKYVQPKYACPNGEGVVVADMPSLPIPKGNAGASLIAYLFVSKYVDHLPFHRIKKIFKRLGIGISESTINKNIVEVTDRFHLIIKYERLYQQID